MLHTPRIAAAFIAISCFSFGAALAAARAAVPDSRTIDYAVRLDPKDPDSRVAWVVSLRVSAVDVGETWVGWNVDQLTITRYDESGEITGSWIEATPTLKTSDGLWWIEHADPFTPLASEFSQPPPVAGIAAAQAESMAALVYNWGSSSSPGGEPLFDGNCAFVDFTFTLQGQSEPEDTGEDEPVEVVIRPENQ